MEPTVSVLSKSTRGRLLLLLGDDDMVNNVVVRDDERLNTDADG